MLPSIEKIIREFKEGPIPARMKETLVRDDLHAEKTLLDHAILSAREMLKRQPDCQVSLMAALYHDVYKIYQQPGGGYRDHELLGMNWVRANLRKSLAHFSPQQRFFLYQMLETHAISNLRKNTLEKNCRNLVGDPNIYLDFLSGNCIGRTVPSRKKRTITTRLKTIDTIRQQQIVGETKRFLHTYHLAGVIKIIESMAQRDNRQILIVYIAPPANDIARLLTQMCAQNMDVGWESLEDIKLDLLRGRSNQVWGMPLSDQYHLASQEISGNLWWPILNSRIQTRIAKAATRVLLVGGNNIRRVVRRSMLKGIDRRQWLRIGVFEDSSLGAHIIRNKEADPNQTEVFSKKALYRMYERLEIPAFDEFDYIVYFHMGFKSEH